MSVIYFDMSFRQILFVVINYAMFLCDTYMMHKVNRYDIYGKRLFESNDKHYYYDNGIIHLHLSHFLTKVLKYQGLSSLSM